MIFADLSALGYFSLMVFDEEIVVRFAKMFAYETARRSAEETVEETVGKSAEGR